MCADGGRLGEGRERGGAGDDGEAEDRGDAAEEEDASQQSGRAGGVIHGAAASLPAAECGRGIAAPARI
jgi:hypothetical protein